MDGTPSRGFLPNKPSSPGNVFYAVPPVTLRRTAHCLTAPAAINLGIQTECVKENCIRKKKSDQTK